MQKRVISITSQKIVRIHWQSPIPFPFAQNGPLELLLLLPVCQVLEVQSALLLFLLYRGCLLVFLPELILLVGREGELPHLSKVLLDIVAG